MDVIGTDALKRLCTTKLLHRPLGNLPILQPPTRHSNHVIQIPNGDTTAPLLLSRHLIDPYNNSQQTSL